jgi:hypothetical protein
MSNETSKTKPTRGDGNDASTGHPTENQSAAQQKHGGGTDEKRQALAETKEGGAHQQPDPEDPLRANEWPHIRVHVPRANRPARAGDGPCARARDSSCGFLRSLYFRIAADLDEPPVRAALGLVLAVVVVALSAVLAPVALFKAVLVAVAGLTGHCARCLLPRLGCARRVLTGTFPPQRRA